MNWEKGGYKCYKLTLFYFYVENIAIMNSNGITFIITNAHTLY